VKRTDVSRLHRLLRVRAGLRQVDVAERARVGRWKISALENNRVGKLLVEELDRCFETLDASLMLTVAHGGAEVDRLLDRRHAALVAAIVRVLRSLGWETRVEVTFNEFGDRGSIDVVGWHAARRALVVIEVKSEIASIEGLLRPFAVKCRLASKIVGEQFGWRPSVVGHVIVLPEDRTARRAVERHAAVFDSTFPKRSRELRSWLRNPAGPIAGVWFVTDVGSHDVTRNPAAIRRLRKPRSRSAASANVAPGDK
jgi:hypothetical protein